MPELLKLLLVEDSDDDAALLLRHLRSGGFEPDHRQVQTAETLREALAEREWDLVISDYSMPNFDGVSAYATLRETGKDIPFIFVSGTLGEDNAVEAMRLGVSDYFVKGKLKRLVPAIHRELNKMEDRRRFRRAEASLREAEQQLKQSQRMEAMGRLAGGVAHDFNNLLTVILGHTNLLVKEIDSSHELWQGLNEIQDCSERAAVLTRQLLQVGSKGTVNRRPVDLHAVVRDAAVLLKRLVGGKITLDLKIPPVSAWILADPEAVERILTNLAVNARDAMSAQGTLTVSVTVRDLTEEDVAGSPLLRPGLHAQLEVGDNGKGIPADVLPHVFEPFFTTKESGKGTGLGLAIVFGAVQQNEGQVSVQSEPGTGTVFRILFPMVGRPDQADRPENESLVEMKASPRGVETILLAEDEESLRDYIRLALARRGFHVLAAADGEQALTLGRLHPGTIHLLLADLRLADGMDGRELSRRLVAEKRPTTRTLFMTGYADPRLLEDMTKGGCNLLLKPFNIEELVKAIREVMDKSRGGAKNDPFIQPARPEAEG